VGKAGYEADDIIGTLAATARGPVDVVTGDRDLFQVVDDSRDVRVIYTARGMSNLEIVTDQVLHAKYGVTAAQYADFAALRGDSSDGLPGVAGVGEKTAASLLAQFGTLDAVIAAVTDPTVPLSAGIRAKITAAADYLTRAPTVVAVARDLDLPATSTRIGLSDADRAAIEALSIRWGLGGAATRAVAALDLAQAKGEAPPQ
jgi:5'-3' exonuclease